MAGGVPSMIDLPPLNAAALIAAVSCALGAVGWLWRLEVRMGHAESDISNDITGRKAVADMRDRLVRIETRLDGIADKLDAR